MPPERLVAAGTPIIPTPALSIENLIVFSSPVATEDRTHHLGHQYVFAALPLTTLTLEMPLSTFVAELALQAAEQRGYRLWRGNLPARHTAHNLLPKLSSLSIEETDFSITAYDALLFRIIHLTNDIKLNLSSHCRKEFLLHPANDQWFYKKRAHLPLLSYLGATMIRDELRESLKTLDCNGPRTWPMVVSATNQAVNQDVNQDASSPVVVITATLESDIHDNRLLDALENTWGFTENSTGEGSSATAALSRAAGLTKAAGRALQNGLEQTVFNLPLPVLSLRSSNSSSGYSSGSPQGNSGANSLAINKRAIKQTPLLLIRLSISKLYISDDILFSDITVNISQANASSEESTVFSSYRTVQIPAATDTEGGVYESLISTGIDSGNEIADFLKQHYIRK